MLPFSSSISSSTSTRQLYKRALFNYHTSDSFATPSPSLGTNIHRHKVSKENNRHHHHRRRLTHCSRKRTKIRHDPSRPYYTATVQQHFLISTPIHFMTHSSSSSSTISLFNPILSTLSSLTDIPSTATLTLLYPRNHWIPSTATYPSTSIQPSLQLHSLSTHPRTTGQQAKNNQQPNTPPTTTTNHNRRTLATFLVIMLSTTSLSSLTHAQLSLGCFASGLALPSSPTSNLPTLPGLTPPYRDIYMSQGACSNYCKTNQFMYAIVQTGTACFCSNQAPPDANHVEDKWCDKPCAGYPFEMCGSAPVDPTVAGGESAGGAGVGRGAYANVMLVGNSLASGAFVTPTLSPPLPATSGTSAVALPTVTTPALVGDNPETKKSSTPEAALKGSLHPEVRNDSQSVQESDGEQDFADDGADDDEDNNSDESGDEDEEGDEGDGDGDGDGEEDSSEDKDQPGNSGKALSGHGKKPSTEASSKIPVASISVAVACLIGICAFLIYLGKKRKRERVRAAWVESVFGANGSTPQGGPSPGPYNNSTMSSTMTGRMTSGISHHSGAGYQQQQKRNNSNLYDDRNSVSDTQTEMERERGGVGMVDRRQSTASTVAGVAATPMSANAGGIGTRRESAMSRTIHNAIMIPAPVVRGGSYGTSTITTTTGAPTWGRGYSNMRGPEPQQHNDGYHYQHEEFFDQEEGKVNAAELAPHMTIDYSTPAPGVGLTIPPTRATGVQRPAAVVYSKSSKGARTSVHPHQPGGSPFDHPPTTTSTSDGKGGGESGGNEYYDTDPFQDLREHRHHQHHLQQRQRHSIHTSALTAAGGGEGHRSSDYRRPHSFSAGSQGEIGGVGRSVVDVEPRTLSYRTHVLDESSDQESITDNEVVAAIASPSASSTAASGTGGGGSNSSTIGKLSGSLLKDHFKRLSSPYVKAIRDQQQQHATDPTSLSCIEEGFPQKDVNSMHSGGNGHESSMPVPGLASGSERRWSRALLKGVVGGVGGGSHRRDSSSEEVGPIEELSGDEQDNGVSCGVKNEGHGHFRGHRQVHSGSLASFRGLDDPSDLRLRVMNPDDGVS